jgi:hypothetical protein
MKNFSETIKELIELKTEGDYWDFKLHWHENKADLLHDIICMANNLANRDGYIIIGIEDETGNIVGISEDDENRKNQQNLIDFLKNKKFSGGIRPTVYVENININDRTIDVVIVKNTMNTPYFLMENYRDKEKVIYPGCIYTRIGDTNTPKTSTADIDKTAILWRKRFGLDLTPFEKAKFLLQNPKDWLPMGTDGVHSALYEYQYIWYNNHFPEFTLSYKDQNFTYESNKVEFVISDMYWLNELPMNGLHETFYYTLSLKYFNTALYATPMIIADNVRFKRIIWKKGYMLWPNTIKYPPITYGYIEKDNIDFLLDNWLCNTRETISATKVIHSHSSLEPWKFDSEYILDNPYNVVPVFENADEHCRFMNYVQSMLDQFLCELSYNDSKLAVLKSSYSYRDEEYIEYLCRIGGQLVEWLKIWRKEL